MMKLLIVCNGIVEERKKEEDNIWLCIEEERSGRQDKHLHKKCLEERKEQSRDDLG